MDTLFARKDSDGKFQPLVEHLHNTATLAANFGSDFSESARIAGALHDIGKAKEDFQQYLESDSAKRGSVIHSYQGAFAVSEVSASQVWELLAKEVLELAITSHHGDLPDCISTDGDVAFFDKMLEPNKKAEKYHYAEVKGNLPLLDLDIQRDVKKSYEDTRRLMQLIQNSGFHGESPMFALGLYVKFIYSRLVDADRMDAALFEAGQDHKPYTPNWAQLINRFEQYIGDFDNTSKINQIRAAISDDCLTASHRTAGIYQLSVPTGGGKTLASMRFALHHAIEQGKTRIIYVIPYLSITTQTSKVLRNSLDLGRDDDTLLEHYSSVMADEEEDEMKQGRRRLAAERWDNPIIVTTMVQFLETVMSSHGTDLRKFHNMANSVIVFDEIQSLPINTVNLFNEIVSFLSKILHSTIVLCSATQPLLENSDRHNLLLAEHPNLIEESERYAAPLKRTNIIPVDEEMDLKQFGQIIFQQAQDNGNCLAVVNLKSEARKIYEYLVNLNHERHFTLVHLSTSMCGLHRAEQLETLQRLLDARQPVICVSTQLIEAGVDISFASVVRAMAGLDSILQSAGRCNRNGESTQSKNVYVIPIKDERGLDMLSDIKQGKEITRRIIREYPNADLSSVEMLHEFYELYFAQRQSEMDYPIAQGEGNAYSLLAFNKLGRGNYVNRTGEQYHYLLAQSFRTVGEQFHVIPDLTQNVIVHYGEVASLLDRFKSQDLKTRIKTIRELQGYSVALFDYEYELLLKRHAITVFDEEFGLFILNEEYYDKQYGVVTAAEMPFLSA